MRHPLIVSFFAALVVLFSCTRLGAEEDPAEKHLDPLETIARFMKLAQSGKSADIKLAAKLIDPDRADQAWANDQLDSTSREMLMTMHVYNFASIFAKDPVTGQPAYALSRIAGPATPPPTAPPASSAAEPVVTPAQEPAAEISETAADRATVSLASGRTIALSKNQAGVWQIVEYSSSLSARADWVATRDRDLDLPPAGQFQAFYLDLSKHDPDYAWRVAMALGEAGRFADLGRLIQFPAAAAPAATPAPAAVPDPKALREREAFLEEQGRRLYSWLRHSSPQRVTKEASGLPRPASEPAGSDLPVVEGQVANFLIWTNDRKRVRLIARPHESADSTLGFGTLTFEWRFDCDCYSPETKRNWIHAQRQQLPEGGG